MKKLELVSLRKCQQSETFLSFDLNNGPPAWGVFFIACARMSKNRMQRDEFKIRVMKLKWDVDQEPDTVWQGEKDLAHKYLNKVLDIIDEYRY